MLFACGGQHGGTLSRPSVRGLSGGKWDNYRWSALFVRRRASCVHVTVAVNVVYAGQQCTRETCVSEWYHTPSDSLGPSAKLSSYLISTAAHHTCNHRLITNMSNWVCWCVASSVTWCDSGLLRVVCALSETVSLRTMPRLFTCQRCILILVNNKTSKSNIKYFWPKNRNIGHWPFYLNRPNSNCWPYWFLLLWPANHTLFTYQSCEDQLAMSKMNLQLLLFFHVFYYKLYACMTSPYCNCMATGWQSCRKVGPSNDHMSTTSDAVPITARNCLRLVVCSLAVITPSVVITVSGANSPTSTYAWRLCSMLTCAKLTVWRDVRRVDWCPLSLKFALKVTHPLSNKTISTSIHS